MKANSDPTPVAHIEDDESVASSSTVQTRDLFPWRWTKNWPQLSFAIELPGWFIVLCTLLLFRGPKEC